MTAFTTSEIIPGVVARIDTQQLRALGGSETNAQLTATEDRAVADTRDFLIVAVDAKNESCTCMPLFNRSSPGSAPLAVAKRQGDVEHWLTDDLHYSHWQHWRIPLARFAAASADDPGEPGARRTFASPPSRQVVAMNAGARTSCPTRWRMAGSSAR